MLFRFRFKSTRIAIPFAWVSLLLFAAPARCAPDEGLRFCRLDAKGEPIYGESFAVPAGAAEAFTFFAKIQQICVNSRQNRHPLLLRQRENRSLQDCGDLRSCHRRTGQSTNIRRAA